MSLEKPALLSISQNILYSHTAPAQKSKYNSFFK
jgi:hypothetical protein